MPAGPEARPCAGCRGQLGDSLIRRRPISGVEPTSRALPGAETGADLRSIVQTVDNELFAVPQFDPAASTREFRLGLTDIGEGIYLPFAVRAWSRPRPRSRCDRCTYRRANWRKRWPRATWTWPAALPRISPAASSCTGVSACTPRCIMRANYPIRDRALTMDQYLSLNHVEVEAPGRSLEVFENSCAEEAAAQGGTAHPHFMSIPVIVGSTDVVATVPQALADFFASMKEFAPGGAAGRTFQVNMYWHRSQTNDPGNQWLRQVIMAQLETLKARAYHRNGRPAAGA